MLDLDPVDGRTFPEGVASALRTISTSKGDNRVPVFRNFAPEVYRGAKAFGLEHTVATDALRDRAEGNGLLEEIGEDALTELMAQARRKVTANGHATEETRKNGRVASNWRDYTITAAALRRETFPPVSYIVPRLIPEGLSILAGRPKVGKSWLALDVCVGVAAGSIVLGDTKLVQGDVLYAALEDSRPRLQRRMDKILSPLSVEWPERLTLTTTWRRLDEGGVSDIEDWALGVKLPRLVVLDTLAGVRPNRKRDETLYDGDYRALQALHRLANDRAFAIVVLHHTRKMEADDPLDTVSGSLGLTGCADTTLVLARTSSGTTLYVRGRDVEELNFSAEFNKGTCRWTVLGEATAVQMTGERAAILKALAGEESLGPKDIAARADMKEGNVRRLLGKMVQSAEVWRVGRARYTAQAPTNDDED